MGSIKQFSATCRPSAVTKNLRRHNVDVSEGGRTRLIAKRTILGKICRFYTSGEHTVDDVRVTAEESHEALLLRYAHASLIIREPVGDKKVIWVDASKNPCEVWIHNMPSRKFLDLAMLAIKTGALGADLVIDGNPLPKMKDIIDEPVKHYDDRMRMLELSQVYVGM